MDIFQALADPSRRNIIELLAKKGKLTSTDISNKFQISAPAISQHLKVLRETRLLKMERKAQQHIYQINPQKIHELERWVKKLAKKWDERFLALDKLLEKEKKKLRGSVKK